MKFVCLVVGLLIPLSETASRYTEQPCSQNEVCVRMRNCSSYKHYVDQKVSNWPERLKICNREIVGKDKVLRVCCPTSLNGKNCGVHPQTSKVANGLAADPFQFPWMALLRDDKGNFVCGGTLINSRFVLTAAHCIREAKIVSVRLGENDINQAQDCIVTGNSKECTNPPQDIKVVERIRHPDYSNRNKINDIALLQLERPATLSDSVRQICLSSRSKHELSVTPKQFFVSGWGVTENNTPSNVLRYAQLPLISHKDCEPRIRELNRAVRLKETHVCAGGVKQSSCTGDSGGPLQYMRDGQRVQYFQYGVVAFGVRTCGVHSEPAVYTRVDQFVDWIHGHVDK